jgi:AmmeMemoRadiSam system protein B
MSREAVREPAVAGLFYPDRAAELEAMVADMLTASSNEGRAPKALIAPHAGYRFSGPTAAQAYARIAPVADQISRVVLLGPAHRWPFRGIATHSADYFRTPLGDVPVDQAARDALLERADTQTLDAAHAGEHSLEVHLPFLQHLLSDFQLIPLVLGDADADAVASLLKDLWGGPETLIVISTDLSHFLDYDSAVVRDRQTADQILACRPEGIDDEAACGRVPLRGLLAAARQRRMAMELIDLCNTGDTADIRDRVVGYAAFAAHETA